MFATGRPIVTGPEPPTGPADTMTVASVGPYAWTRRRPCDQAPASAGPIGSAPTTIRVRSGTSSGFSTSRSDGTTLVVVMPASRIRRLSAPPSERSAEEAITRVPPAASVTATSRTEASKLNEVNCRTPVPGSAPSAGARAVAMFATLACATPTPFGRPVEPDV
ncbi:hypothetical protein Airi02_030120 [Actinoallomurus iriomotensis]|uniref:Uncharacterized protein n=1 Tax=Actinoallomurus iriomotensis TaxID=478107 RepID=A0A9W6S0N3_9ACTN|nr:hypothetical protein Airi02_030120 [Actinoallomurus iriomotensis]